MEARRIARLRPTAARRPRKRGRLDERPPLWRRPVAWFVGVILLAVTGLATDTFAAVLRSWLNPDELADRIATSPPISVAGFERDALYGWSTPASVPTDDVLDAPVDSPDEARHTDWLRRHDAHGLMQEDISFTLRGERAQPVVITQFRPKLVSCGPPLSGAVFFAPPEGQNDVKQLTVNLDHRVPIFHEWDGLSDRSAPEPYFAAHTISLGQGEQMTFLVTAFAGERSCKWHLEADMLVSGREETLTLTEATGPLAVTGEVKPTQYRDFYVLSYLLPDVLQPEMTEMTPNFTRVDPARREVDPYEEVCVDGQPTRCLGRPWSTEFLPGYVE